MLEHGGFTLYDPDKTINYEKTPESARYAFTFWAFPRDNWVKNLHDYVDFAERPDFLWLLLALLDFT